jgi:putative polyketide hydroxylase
VVGYGYTSAAIVPEPGQPAPGPGTTDLRGRPGTRAPHVWLSRDGTRISTLDLLGRNFVLIAGRDGTAWIDAANRRAIDSVRIGTDVEDPDNRWHDANGVTTTGAILVRPDGFIAWRARAAHAAPDDALHHALNGVLCRATALAA